MKPGPTIIIACPNCGQYAKKKTLLSGNGFGAQLWSDGKRVLPMLPVFPSLVVCKKCNQFYWVKDAKEVERVDYQLRNKGRWKNIKFVEFPTFRQYFKALKTISEEKFIRINIWWSYNDYIRNNIKKHITPMMYKKHTENLTALLKILNETDNDELIMKAEVYRNLSQFEESKNLLNRITDAKLASTKEKLLHEIKNQNKRVIQLY